MKTFEYENKTYTVTTAALGTFVQLPNQGFVRVNDVKGDRISVEPAGCAPGDADSVVQATLKQDA